MPLRTHRIEVFADGTYRVTKFYPPPIPVPAPTIGWFVYAWDGQKPARARHDYPSRTFSEKIKLIQTNETVALRPMTDGVPDPRSKEITLLDRRWEWVRKFIDMMTYYIWGQYVQPGFGYQDTNEDHTNPDVGPFKQQSLSCGGNLFNVLSERIWTSLGAHLQIQIQDFYQPVDWTLTYESAPHLVTKQVLVGHNAAKETYYITDQKRGDITWPMVCDKPLAVAESDIEYLPKLPFVTKMNGYDITFVVYCFTGSSTYGMADDGNWYLIEEMVVSGIGSCSYDRRVYVDEWIKTCPPPIKGWTRSEPTLLEKVINFLKF